MKIDNLAEMIVKHGTAAVLRYRAISGVSQDNLVPEIFFGSFIAGGLYDDLKDSKLQAHVEHLYTLIAQDHGVPLTSSLLNIFGGHRADIAIYQNDKPRGIVELKVFDDYAKATGIISDRDKMMRLSSVCPIETYAGVLITDVGSGRNCTARARDLEDALEQKFDVVGEPQLSLNGKWSWCFASGKLTHLVSARTGGA